MVQLSHLYVATGKTIALTIQTHEAHLSMEFSSQEYWSGLHFLLQGIFLTQGSNKHLLHWQADSLPLSHQESPFVGEKASKSKLSLKYS